MSETFSLQLSDLQPGYQFRQYQLLEQIGLGGQGTVWSALDQSKNQIVAIKFNELTGANQKRVDDRMFERQAARLCALQHPNILPTSDYGISQQIRFMVSPYIPGGTLEDRLRQGKLELLDLLHFALEIASALDYLHENNIIHRDLKPSNVLIDFSNHVYVADFGLARIISKTTLAMHTGRGTPPYSPPEQHVMQTITPQSDIFSFGIMLYEMFAGELPWKGEKGLGLQQLYAQEELPDPAEITPGLPGGLVTTLRQMTSANQAARPSNAAEAIRQICQTFQLDPDQLQADRASAETTPSRLAAHELLKRSLAHWEPRQATVPLSLTRFAFVDLEEKRRGMGTLPLEIQEVMLQMALTFGYEDSFWWSRVVDPNNRLVIAGSLIARDNEVITGRVINHLLKDPALRKLQKAPPARMTQALLNIAVKSNDPLLRGQILKVLLLLTPGSTTWRANAFPERQDGHLATLALEDSDFGEAAARLIGSLHSNLAVDLILKTVNEDRQLPVLLAIQETAGSLPPFVKLRLRLSVTAEWLLRRSLAQPIRLLWLYGLAFFGTFLGASLRVYLTYRLPDFLDFERIFLSLEHGVFLGAGFGLGILLAKLLVERFPEIRASLRLGIASLAGGLVLNMMLFTYNVLFLKTIPSGLLAPLGCFLIAGGYATAGLYPLRLPKILASTTAIFVALAGTWIGHLTLSLTTYPMVPVFYYDYAWNLAQILGINLLISLTMGIFPNLVNLAAAEE